MAYFGTNTFIALAMMRTPLLRAFTLSTARGHEKATRADFNGNQAIKYLHCLWTRICHQIACQRHRVALMTHDLRCK